MKHNKKKYMYIYFNYIFYRNSLKSLNSKLFISCVYTVIILLITEFSKADVLFIVMLRGYEGIE